MSMKISGEEVYEICLRCAEPNLEGTSRCQKCQAPLDPSARDHPWELKTANHHAYAEAASPRTKPIIFWGAWVYFGPSAVWALSLVYIEIKYRFNPFDPSNDDFFQDQSNLDIFAPLAIPIAYGLLSIWALWAVTKGYLSRPSPKNKGDESHQ